MHRTLTIIAIMLLLFSCHEASEKPLNNKHSDTLQAAPQQKETTAAAPKSDKPFKSGQVPILCYHQIRDFRPTDSKSSQVYIVPVATFKQHMKMLHDSGYHTILPDQLMGYLLRGESLPSKPIMLTFDDATLSQYENALPELDKNGFKSVFFIMTVVLGRPNYLTRDQVKEIDKRGHVIGCHTWDHHMVTKYKEDDWKVQVEKPRSVLEGIIGHPVNYFAYPFGLWNTNAVAHIKQYKFTAAFQLALKMDKEDPIYTIRRIIPDGHWDAAKLLKAIKSDF